MVERSLKSRAANFTNVVAKITELTWPTFRSAATKRVGEGESKLEATTKMLQLIEEPADFEPSIIDMNMDSIIQMRRMHSKMERIHSDAKAFYDRAGTLSANTKADDISSADLEALKKLAVFLIDGIDDAAHNMRAKFSAEDGKFKRPTITQSQEK